MKTLTALKVIVEKIKVEFLMLRHLRLRGVTGAKIIAHGVILKRLGRAWRS
jgi:hypothetical protein